MTTDKHAVYHSQKAIPLELLNTERQRTIDSVDKWENDMNRSFTKI